MLAQFGAPARRDRWGAVAHTLTPFSPVVDGEVLPADPWTALANGHARDVELVIGHNRDECRLFTVGNELVDAEITSALAAFSPPGGAAAYRAAYPEADDQRLYELAYSDWLFRMPAVHLADAHTQGGGTTYLYELAYPAPGAGGALGACHGLDVPLVFGTLQADFGAMMLGDPVPDAAIAVADRMRADWTTFAAAAARPAAAAARPAAGWPRYDPRQRLTRVYDTQVTDQTYPEETSRRLWAEHRFAALPLL